MAVLELPVVGVVSAEEIARAVERRKQRTKPRAYIQTLGCQMNEHDTEIMFGMLAQIGYERTDDLLDADVILYNTCCVRENPERKLYGQMGMLRQLKAADPDLIIGVCGCMTQQPTELERMRHELEHVDLVFGTLNIHRLPELLHRARATGERVIEVWHEEGEIVEGLPVQRLGKLKAYVTIIYGCNEKCTSCIVPTVRGRERSRAPEQIVAEVEELAQEGYKEIMLLGQNVNAYGNDLERPVDFADLLRRIDAVPGIERIRFTSPHPKHFTDRVIAAMAECEHVCEHVHLPAQAGSDRVLRRMGRRYTRAEYLALVEKMRRRIPGLAVTTDLIVGFPGETEEDFQETLRLVREAEYDSAFMFMYSPRHGTPATKLRDHVPEPIKRDRIHRLIALQNEISLAKNRRHVGQVLEVLVEGESKNDPERVFGRARNNKLVTFRGDAGRLVGQTVPVRITGAQTWSLVGERQAG
ncbi:MAG TPA: tRNA (N6-isopentenyl adenosine(37)-C2)-methylthiotransferase MiaB [Limnochordia bacterium]